MKLLEQNEPVFISKFLIPRSFLSCLGRFIYIENLNISLYRNELILD